MNLNNDGDFKKTGDKVQQNNQNSGKRLGLKAWRGINQLLEGRE